MIWQIFSYKNAIMRTYQALILIFLIILLIIFIMVQHYMIIYDLYVRICSKDDLGPFPSLRRRKSIKDLKRMYPTIREEMIKNRKHFSAIRGDLFFEDKIIKTDKWKKVYLKWYSKSPSYAYKLFPSTMEFIDRNKDIKLAMFSLLEPGGRILPHCGPFAGCIRVHLCLTGPNDDRCYISVGGKKYSWREGEIVCFNDTYRHYVVNNTDKERVVLFLDVERKMKLSALNKWIIKTIAPRTTRMNDELEKMSSVNNNE